MAILNQKRILNLIPKISAPVTIHVSQGDVGTEIEFTLVKGDEVFVNPGNVSASVHGVREDGANFGPFTCTLSGSKVTFPLHSEMTAVKGSAIAEIVLVDNGGNKVGSANFGILVEESVFPLGVTYDNDVSVYESILAYVQTIPAQLQSNISDVDMNLKEEIAERIKSDDIINTRIDELIAPSGEAPNPAEIVDARIGVDNKTYDTLGSAIREQMKSKADKGYKIGTIVASTLTSNYLKGKNGTDYAASGFGEYITATVNSDTAYLISGVTYGSSTYPLCIFYDSSNNVIGYYEPFVASTNYENLVVRTPLNCTKIVINGSQIRIHAAIYNAIEMTINEIIEEVEKIPRKADKGFMPGSEVTSVLTLDTVISITNDEFPASNWGEYITADVTENTPYLINGCTFGANSYALCNFYHDSTLLGYYSPIVTNTRYYMEQIITPPGCNKIIVNGSQTTIGAAIYNTGAEITINKIANAIKRPINFGCIGDSITVEGNTKQWPSYVCEYLATLNKHNVAFGAGTYAWRAVTFNGVTYYPQNYTDPDFAGYFGGTITTAEEAQKTANNCSKCIVEQFISEVNDGVYPIPDVFVFAYGTNDDYVDIGSVEEAFSDSLENIDKYKMAGAERYAIQSIQNAFPDCKVFVLSTLQTVYGTHEHNAEKNAVIKGVADYLSCSFIDQYNNSGISSIYERAGQAGRFLQDGLHPNNAGRKRQAAFIAPQILSMFVQI